jgi:alpha-L-fucosidase
MIIIYEQINQPVAIINLAEGFSIDEAIAQSLVVDFELNEQIKEQHYSMINDTYAECEYIGFTMNMLNENNYLKASGICKLVGKKMENWKTTYYAKALITTMSKFVNIPEDEFYDYWLNQINEVVDEYAPDMIWFDSWLDIIPENYQQKMVAHHFNTAVSRGQKPIVNYKQEDLPANVGILDMEQGGKTELSDDYWLTDITISYGSWSYTNGQTYKNPSLVIRNMIDVWSKRGIVLLNISPMANGIIPDAQREVLAAIGNWIEKHKEAVYETRAYSTFGYGRAEFEASQFGGQTATMDYNHNDIRFAVSKDQKNLFVYSLGLPEPNSTFDIHHVAESNIKRVSVVGIGVELKWLKTVDVLTITTPGTTEMDELATVFKVEFE